MLISVNRTINSRIIKFASMSFKSTLVDTTNGKRRMNDRDVEPEVWKFLDDHGSKDESKKQLRLEKAKRFLKMTESKAGRRKIGKNTFLISEETVTVADIELPPPLPQETGPPPPLPPSQPLQIHAAQSAENPQNSRINPRNNVETLEVTKNIYSRSVRYYSTTSRNEGRNQMDRLAENRPWVHNTALQVISRFTHVNIIHVPEL